MRKTGLRRPPAEPGPVPNQTSAPRPRLASPHLVPRGCGSPHPHRGARWGSSHPRPPSKSCQRCPSHGARGGRTRLRPSSLAADLRSPGRSGLFSAGTLPLLPPGPRSYLAKARRGEGDRWRPRTGVRVCRVGEQMIPSRSRQRESAQRKAPRSRRETPGRGRCVFRQHFAPKVPGRG